MPWARQKNKQKDQKWFDSFLFLHNHFLSVSTEHPKMEIPGRKTKHQKNNLDLIRLFFPGSFENLWFLQNYNSPPNHSNNLSFP